MNLKEAIEVLKEAKYIGSDKYATDYDKRMNEAIDTVVEALEKPLPTDEIISEILAKVCDVKTETIDEFKENVSVTITLQQAIESMDIYGKQQYNQCLEDLIADDLLPDKEKNLKKYMK